MRPRSAVNLKCMIASTSVPDGGGDDPVRPVEPRARVPARQWDLAQIVELEEPRESEPRRDPPQRALAGLHAVLRQKPRPRSAMEPDGPIRARPRPQMRPGVEEPRTREIEVFRRRVRHLGHRRGIHVDHGAPDRGRAPRLQPRDHRGQIHAVRQSEKLVGVGEEPPAPGAEPVHQRLPPGMQRPLAVDQVEIASVADERHAIRLRGQKLRRPVGRGIVDQREPLDAHRAVMREEGGEEEHLVMRHAAERQPRAALVAGADAQIRHPAPTARVAPARRPWSDGSG